MQCVMILAFVTGFTDTNGEGKLKEQQANRVFLLK